MQIEHFILSNNSSIDMNNNSLSVFGILDDMQIQAPHGLTLNLGFHAILVVKRDGESGPIHSSFKMSITGPNGNKIGQDLQLPVALEPIHRRTRLRVIAEIPVAHSGIYTVRMVSFDKGVENEKISREVSLNIQILPVAVPTPAQTPH
jgi:hypothetical protein